MKEVPVYVGVIDAGGECKFWGFEGVVGGEVDVEEEDATLEGGVGGAQDSGLQGTLYCTMYFIAHYCIYYRGK